MKAIVLGQLIPLSPSSTPIRTHSSSKFRHHSSIIIPSNKKPLQILTLKFQNPSSSSFSHKFCTLVCHADNNNSIDDLLSTDENKKRETEEGGGENTNGNGGGDKGNGNNGRPRLNLNWINLLVDPDPDNVLAVGLTGVLAWASVQVLWQLFVISIAIVLAALKYSFIAALLIFILITLL